MKCVILQPFYIPWRGYFHQIHKADTFIFYDDVQFEKRGWESRNRIKTAHGAQWLSIPVLNKGSITDGTPINEIEFDKSQSGWREKHWKTVKQSYGKAPFFPHCGNLLRKFYSGDETLLADFTINSTIELARELKIEKTRFRRASEFQASGRKTDRLLDILEKVGATRYISGAAAKNYIETEKFREAKIELEYMVYDYPEYEQLHPPFDGAVSVIDLLLMKGVAAENYIWKNS